MKTIESIKLSSVLRLVSNPKYVLGTTYSLSLAFFESVVYPYIRNNQLKSAVILCDILGYRRALSESAALQGAAQVALGVFAREGRGMPKDDDEAVKWFRKAAELGFARGRFELGVMYNNGLGVPLDGVEAAKWFREAAEQRDAEAQAALESLNR